MFLYYYPNILSIIHKSSFPRKRESSQPVHNRKQNLCQPPFCLHPLREGGSCMEKAEKIKRRYFTREQKAEIVRVFCSGHRSCQGNNGCTRGCRLTRYLDSSQSPPIITFFNIFEAAFFFVFIPR